jgi:uncharacterized membrane protein YqaE (UPF0057 family)
MKKAIFYLLAPVVLLTSCQSSSDLGSTAILQKRKYTKGFHLNVKQSAQPSADEIMNEEENSESQNATTAVYNNNATEKALPASPLTPIQNTISDYQENNSNLANLRIERNLLSTAHASVQSDSENLNIDTPKPTVTSPTIDLTKQVSTPDFERYYDESVVSRPAPMAPAAGAEVTLLIIIITIILPPLGVALVFGLSKEFWISLLLTILLYFPGLIYSLIKIL